MTRIEEELTQSAPQTRVTEVHRVARGGHATADAPVDTVVVGANLEELLSLEAELLGDCAHAGKGWHLDAESLYRRVSRALGLTSRLRMLCERTCYYSQGHGEDETGKDDVLHGENVAGQEVGSRE